MAVAGVLIASVMACLQELSAETKYHMGTLDYIAKRYYMARDEYHGKDADQHLLKYMKAEDADKVTRKTAWLGESPNMQLGSYVLEECGFTRGNFAYFCTFDFNGYVLKYDSIGVAGSFAVNQAQSAGLRLMESLPLGRHGGHFLAAAAHGAQYGFFATAGAPAAIVTVNLDTTPLSVVSNLTLPADYGGIFAMSVDSGSSPLEQILLAIVGRPPVRIALFSVSSAGVLTEKQVHAVADDDEAACPSSAFVDRGTKTALIATVGGCVHRVSYAGGMLQTPAGWAKVCSTSASRFRRMAVAKQGQVAVVGSFYPLRQLLLLDLSVGRFSDAMPLPNRDIMFVTNIMSTNNDDVYVVGNSMKGMPAVMQLDLRGTNRLNNLDNWGIIAAGVCDEYSWTGFKRKRYSGDSTSTAQSYWPIRYYGCTWIPKGREASGAVLSPEGRLYIAAKRQRCTVCTEQEQEFTMQGGFCIEEFEDYRSPASDCGQHSHNRRPFVRERMLSVAELQRESNTLAGGENFTLIEFQLGQIPEAGEMHAPVIKSHARSSHRSSLGAMLGMIFFALGNLNLLHPGSGRSAFRRVDVLTAAALLALMVSPAVAQTGSSQTQAVTKSFHQHEYGCQCLLGCSILGEDSGDCTDNNRKNAEVWERKLGQLPNDNHHTCELMKCIAYCAGPEAKAAEMMGRQDELVCASIAKQIGCEMDCSSAYRCLRHWLLHVVLVIFLLSWAA